MLPPTTRDSLVFIERALNSDYQSRLLIQSLKSQPFFHLPCHSTADRGIRNSFAPKIFGSRSSQKRIMNNSVRSTQNISNDHPPKDQTEEVSSENIEHKDTERIEISRQSSPVSQTLGTETADEDDLTAPKTIDGFVDYNRIYEGLQERFHKAHATSQKLFITEKTQRRTLYHYKRRVNVVLDMLQNLEEEEEGTVDVKEPFKIDSDRLALVISLRPELQKCLGPAILLASLKEDPADIILKHSCAVNLAVDEMIPEISNDELDNVELNPQDTDMWVRRNFTHLVVSKFRPAEIRAKNVREYVDPLAQGSKRKRRS